MTFEPINYQNEKTNYFNETGMQADADNSKYLLWLNYKTSENVIRQLVLLNKKLDTDSSVSKVT